MAIIDYAFKNNFRKEMYNLNKFVMFLKFYQHNYKYNVF